VTLDNKLHTDPVLLFLLFHLNHFLLEISNSLWVPDDFILRGQKKIPECFLRKEISAKKRVLKISEFFSVFAIRPIQISRSGVSQALQVASGFFFFVCVTRIHGIWILPVQWMNFMSSRKRCGVYHTVFPHLLLQQSMEFPTSPHHLVRRCLMCWVTV
jgi:hypothetical protein